MAAALPAAIGLGSSLVSGIFGKKAKKKQSDLAEKQLRQLQPLIDAQLRQNQFAFDQARQLYPGVIGQFGDVYNRSIGASDTAFTDYRKLLDDATSQRDQLVGQGQGLLEGSLPYLQGASSALDDLRKFYRPFMFEGQRAIDRFLPTAQRTHELLAPEFGAVNQGFRSASENIARFAPRGGGRVSSLAQADLDRQSQLSNVFFGGRENLLQQALGAAFQGAGGRQNEASALTQLGLGQGQLGLGTIGAGTQAYGTGGGLAQNAFGQGLQSLGLGLTGTQGLGNLSQGLLGAGIQGNQSLFDFYNQQANRAYGASPRQVSGGKSLSDYLVNLFSSKPIQDRLDNIFGGGK